MKNLEKITVRGARTHNLKNIDVELPRNKLIVITGVSGSGKSSLAFDTIYAEGQRRYVESLSSYARQFLSMMDKPDIDHIEGLSPAISIEQKSTSHNPRSTVGTVTEIYDYLRLLFARSGTARCPTHGVDLEAQTVSQITEAILKLQGKYMILAPVVQDKKGEHAGLFAKYQAQGFTKVRVNGEIYDIEEPPTLGLRQKHSIEIVVDRFVLKEGDGASSEKRGRLSESLETALKINDIVMVAPLDKPLEEEKASPALLGKSKSKGSTLSDTKNEGVLVFSSKHACPICNYSVANLEPRLFSFNAPSGACPSCNGLGEMSFLDEARVVRNGDLSLSQGAIVGWGKANPGFFARIESVAKHYGFATNVPWNSLDEKYRNALLYGTGRESIKIHYQGGYVHRKPFEGVMNNLKRRLEQLKVEEQEDLLPYMSEKTCPTCMGSRLNEQARHVFVQNHSLPQLSQMTISSAKTFFDHLHLEGWKGEVAVKIVKEICERLTFLQDVGLNYLSLDRRADTLSGGEAQRIRLASQIGAGLVGVMYVLDEPSIGLHQRDNDRLLHTLIKLRDLGNTVIVVEHDEDAIRMADYVLDIGPKAGVHGGMVVGSGTVDDIIKSKLSLTGEYLSGKKEIAIPKRKPKGDKFITIEGAKGNNLNNVSVDIPLGLMTCVTGVSGSGKSTLINDTLYAEVAAKLNNAATVAAPHKSIKGLEQLDKIVDINQSPIGRTPRSNPATYTGLFTPLRELFAQVPEARSRGYTPGRFSFNVKGGRCEACSGDGVLKVEMHFLPDVYVACDVCQGKRYNQQTLDIVYKGYNIHQVLEMTVEKAMEVFHAVPNVVRKLETLERVGLGYIKLGQSATTLSGGEAQRVKLSKELSKKSTGKTLYILDEPTTGLHFYDIDHLLTILHELKNEGNTVVVIEHNLDVIKTADWIIDLGPEGGSGGGLIVAEGTPEDIANHPTSYTGEFLAPLLNAWYKRHPKNMEDPVVKRKTLKGNPSKPNASKPDASKKSTKATVKKTTKKSVTQKVVKKATKSNNKQEAVGNKVKDNK